MYIIFNIHLFESFFKAIGDISVDGRFNATSNYGDIYTKLGPAFMLPLLHDSISTFDQPNNNIMKNLGTSINNQMLNNLLLTGRPFVNETLGILNSEQSLQTTHFDKNNQNINTNSCNQIIPRTGGQLINQKNDNSYHNTFGQINPNNGENQIQNVNDQHNFQNCSNEVQLQSQFSMNGSPNTNFHCFKSSEPQMSEGFNSFHNNNNGYQNSASIFTDLLTQVVINKLQCASDSQNLFKSVNFVPSDCNLRPGNVTSSIHNPSIVDNSSFSQDEHNVRFECGPKLAQRSTTNGNFIFQRQMKNGNQSNLMLQNENDAVNLQNFVDNTNTMKVNNNVQTVKYNSKQNTNLNTLSIKSSRFNKNTNNFKIKRKSGQFGKGNKSDFNYFNVTPQLREFNRNIEFGDDNYDRRLGCSNQTTEPVCFEPHKLAATFNSMDDNTDVNNLGQTINYEVTGNSEMDNRKSILSKQILQPPPSNNLNRKISNIHAPLECNSKIITRKHNTNVPSMKTNISFKTSHMRGFQKHTSREQQNTCVSKFKCSEHYANDLDGQAQRCIENTFQQPPPNMNNFVKKLENYKQSNSATFNKVNVKKRRKNNLRRQLLCRSINQQVDNHNSNYMRNKFRNDGQENNGGNNRNLQNNKINIHKSELNFDTSHLTFDKVESMPFGIENSTTSFKKCEVELTTNVQPFQKSNKKNLDLYPASGINSNITSAITDEDKTKCLLTTRFPIVKLHRINESPVKVEMKSITATQSQCDVNNENIDDTPNIKNFKVIT